MTDALSPREIQSRIRAGASVQDVVDSSGMPVSAVEPFAGPVLAERAYIANQATRGQVHRTDTPTHQTLAEIVGDRLASRGLTSADVTWDAWRGNDRLWTLRASYRSGSALHEGVFRYDPAGRFSTAVDDEARWLVGERSAAHGPQRGRRPAARGVDVDSEPTIDLDPARLGGPHIDFEPDDYSPAKLAEVDGIYDLVTEPEIGMDVLYDMLAGFNEDSVRIYEGLTRKTTEPSAEPLPMDDDPALNATGTAPSSEPGELPTKPHDEAKEPTQRIPKSKKRATVPTWDEIMFGSPQAG
ncbi:MAG: septation protein SepH [Propionibacteriaceae bacterium]|nr:septation protein SepH [Propionibacteriaceae bacterium]